MRRLLTVIVDSQVRCKRLADLKDHFETHNLNAVRYQCDYW